MSIGAGGARARSSVLPPPAARRSSQARGRLTEVIDHVDSLARAETERQREAHEKGFRDLEAWEWAGAADSRGARVTHLLPRSTASGWGARRCALAAPTRF
jgi:hypothetical protein